MRSTPAILLALSLFCGSAAVAAPPSKMEQAKAKENKADLTANVAINREVIQLLERSKKRLQASKGKDTTGHRARAIEHIQKAMFEVRAQTSKPGH